MWIWLPLTPMVRPSPYPPIERMWQQLLLSGGGHTVAGANCTKGGWEKHESRDWIEGGGHVRPFPSLAAFSPF